MNLPTLESGVYHCQAWAPGDDDKPIAITYRYYKSDGEYAVIETDPAQYEATAADTVYDAIEEDIENRKAAIESAFCDQLEMARHEL